MTRRVVVILIGLLSVLLSVRCQRAAPTHHSQLARVNKRVRHDSNVIRTTVCKIAEDPRPFYEKRVTVEGCVSTDGIERVLLLDNRCPYVGISEIESARLPQSQRFMLDANKRACGTFTGTFHAATMLGKVVVNENVLEIEETSNINVVTQ